MENVLSIYPFLFSHTFLSICFHHSSSMYLLSSSHPSAACCARCLCAKWVDRIWQKCVCFCSKIKLFFSSANAINFPENIFSFHFLFWENWCLRLSRLMVMSEKWFWKEINSKTLYFVLSLEQGNNETNHCHYIFNPLSLNTPPAAPRCPIQKEKKNIIWIKTVKKYKMEKICRINVWRDVYWIEYKFPFHQVSLPPRRKPTDSPYNNHSVTFASHIYTTQHNYLSRNERFVKKCSENDMKDDLMCNLHGKRGK